MTDITVYFALLASGKEPPAESGYERQRVVTDIFSILNMLHDRQIVFPDVTEPGYGMIDEMAVYAEPAGGDMLCYWPVPKPVDMHAGVVPAVINGRLIRGVDVTAQVLTGIQDLCSMCSM